MRHESHKTLIATVRSYVGQWRKRESWSREAVAAVVAEAHSGLGADQLTGIRFDPPTKDPFERAKVIADRLFRWLDDETKDGNLLPANLVPSLLASMPDDLRLHCVNELLRPLGLAARKLGDVSSETVAIQQGLVDMIREDAESQQAFAVLMSGTQSDALEVALREINEAIETKTRMRQVIEAALSPSGKVHSPAAKQTVRN